MIAARMAKASSSLEVKQVEFDGTWPWSLDMPDWYRSGLVGTATEQAMGVPALLGVISLIAGAVGQCPAIVYEEDAVGARTRARESYQWRLLHDRPSSESTASLYRSDLAACLAASGSFAVRKYKARGKVIELVVLDPRRVKPVRKNGAVVYEDSSEGTGAVDRTAKDIIYGRLFSATGGLCGVSPITNLRRSTAAALAREEYQQRVMQNDARPGMVFKTRQTMDQEQADTWIDNWVSRHSGPPNAGKPTIISSRDDIEVIPVNLKDLQFVEQNQVTRETLAGAYHLPTVYVGDGVRAPVYEDRVSLATFCLGPFLQAIEDAHSADEDLFPRFSKSHMFVELLPDALLRMSTRERYASYKDARQAGIMTGNEIRDIENLPPHDDGEILQQVPVGGAVPGSAVTDPTPQTPETEPTP